jgi:hypothetical protein
MNTRDELAAAVEAMSALPMPIGDAATAAESGKDTHGQAPRRGESTPAVRSASKVAAFLAGARNSRATTGGAR